MDDAVSILVVCFHISVPMLFPRTKTSGVNCILSFAIFLFYNLQLSVTMKQIGQ